MFREMKRSKQLLSMEETAAVMDRCTNGALACLGDDDYPYSIPLSYVYFNEKIYFHSAKAGHKIDAIINHPKVSFSVVDEDTIVSEKYTSYFRSVIAFGTIRVLTDDAEKRAALGLLAAKYSANQPEKSRSEEIDGAYSWVCVLELSIAHLTGKEALELVNTRQS